MRRRLRALGLFTLLLGILAACGEDAATLQSPTMARIGTTNITEVQFTQLLQQQAQGIAQFTQQGGSAELARQQLFENMIREEVVLSEARRAGIGVDEVTDAQFNQELITNVQVEGKAATLRDYQSYIKERYNRDSVAEFQADFYRKAILDRYAQTAQLEGVSPAVKTRVIIIEAPTDPADPEFNATKQKAEQVVARLRAGENFAGLVREVVTNPDLVKSGGEAGWVDPAQISPQLAQVGQALTTLSLNEISDPIQIQGAWFIVQVTQRGTFPGWSEMLQSPAGQAYIEQKVAEYTTNNQIQYFIDPATVPLPASIQQ